MLNPKDDLSIDYLKSIFSYNPESGELRWKARPISHFAEERAYRAWHTKFEGKIAGHRRTARRTTYRIVNIKGRNYRAHRIAYAMHYGVWPDGLIDHINGFGLDNRIENLRAVSYLENNRNRRARLDSATGVIGVHLKKSGKYQVRISVDGSFKYLGSFDTIEEAAEVRRQAELEYGYTSAYYAKKLYTRRPTITQTGSYSG